MLWTWLHQNQAQSQSEKCYHVLFASLIIIERLIGGGLRIYNDTIVYISKSRVEVFTSCLEFNIQNDGKA